MSDHSSKRGDYNVIISYLETINKKVEQVHLVIQSPVFIRNFDFLKKHGADQEELQRIMCSSYGSNKTFDGWELIKAILHDYAEKLENKKVFKKSILTEFGKYTLKAICYILVALISVIVSGKAGFISYLAKFFK